MTKFLSICSLIAMLLSGCGSDFPGQPSDVARVQQNKYPNGNLKEEIPYNNVGGKIKCNHRKIK